MLLVQVTGDAHRLVGTRLTEVLSVIQPDNTSHSLSTGPNYITPFPMRQRIITVLVTVSPRLSARVTQNVVVTAWTYVYNSTIRPGNFVNQPA